MATKKIIFVTGTDTGVGKTLLAALLLFHLRQKSGRALAMKPFCSGGLSDVRLLQALQPSELTAAEMNPFYFAQPIAPLVAARKNAKPIRLDDVLNRINAVAKTCDRLVIEGSGGLLVPLGKGFTVADIIAQLDCQVIVASRNRLGTINHTLLTVHALKTMNIEPKRIAVVLMSGKKSDLSSQTNEKVLSDLLKPVKVSQIPFLGTDISNPKSIAEQHLKLKKMLSTLI